MVSAWWMQTYGSGNFVGLGNLSLEDGQEGCLRLFLAFFCQLVERVSCLIDLLFEFIGLAYAMVYPDKLFDPLYNNNIHQTVSK